MGRNLNSAASRHFTRCLLSGSGMHLKTTRTFFLILATKKVHMSLDMISDVGGPFLHLFFISHLATFDIQLKSTHATVAFPPIYASFAPFL